MNHSSKSILIVSDDIVFSMSTCQHKNTKNQKLMDDNNDQYGKQGARIWAFPHHQNCGE